MIDEQPTREEFRRGASGLPTATEARIVAEMNAINEDTPGWLPVPDGAVVYLMQLVLMLKLGRWR